MTRFAKIIGLSVAAAALSTAALAQQQGGGQFAAIREKYKYTFQLMQMARHIGEIDKDKKYALTQKQAQQVLAALKPLRTKPKLTQDQAKQAIKQLKKPLTAAQLNALARVKPAIRSGPRPGGGSQDGRPPQGGARRFDPNAMKDFNPFYLDPKATDEWAKQRQKRWNDFFANLEKKAKGTAKPTSDPPAKPSTNKK